ncbi:MAG: hypothetical protein LBI03_06475 [Clostridiales bacterium]|nr:hypothetical protein [Clostridiales bacterium]
MIDFYNNRIYSWYGTYQLSGIGMDLKVSGCLGSGYKYVDADDQLEAILLVGDIDGNGKNYEAYLVIKANNTTAVVYEIENLFLFAVDPDEKQLAVYYNHRPFENNMALLFSNDAPLPFIPDILEDIKHSKLSEYVAGLSNNNVPIPSSQHTETTASEKNYEYTQHRFTQMATQLMEFDGQDFSQRPKPNKDAPCLLHDDNLPKFDQQTLSPEQMREACEAIREKVRQDESFKEDSGFNTEINFLDFTQKYGGDTFYLSDTVVCFKGISEDKTIGCGFLECYRLDVRVLIGDYKGTTRAFIEAERATGKYCIAELSEFGMLSTFEANGSNLGVMTFFNKELDVVNFNVFNSPREKHSPRIDIPVDTTAPRYRSE